MTTTASPQKKTTVDEAYRILVQQVEKFDAKDVIKPILDRVDYYTLEDYNASTTVPDEEKLATYREMVKAVLMANGKLTERKAEPKEIDPATVADVPKLFTELCSKVNAAGSEWHKRIAAHLRAVTGRTIPLPVYNSDRSIPDKDKAALYLECIAAINANDPKLLKGKTGAGDKRAEPDNSAAAPPDNKDNGDTIAESKEVVKPSVQSEEGDAVLEEALQAVRLAARLRSKQPVVDEALVRSICQDFFEKAMGGVNIPDDDEIKQLAKEAFSNGGFPRERVEEIFAELSRNLVHRIEFKTPTGETKTLEGIMHPQVPQIAAWLMAGVPVWAWGAAGAGKTHMARQIAELLGVEPRVISIDPTLTVAKLMGYRNVANGEFVEGFVYQSFKNGGLVAADETDTGDPGVLACANALLSNTHYLFPNNETVERHNRFYWLALANTKGTGAVAGYTARNRLDAATLDRFAVIEIKYDEGMETALACGECCPGTPWKPGEPASLAVQKAYVAWVHKVRANVGNSVLISPRASINGCKALRAGIPPTEVVDALVLKLVTEDTRKRIIDSCGVFTGGKS